MGQPTQNKYAKVLQHPKLRIVVGDVCTRAGTGAQTREKTDTFIEATVLINAKFAPSRKLRVKIKTGIFKKYRREVGRKNTREAFNPSTHENMCSSFSLVSAQRGTYVCV